jgi:hypothetical protein
MRFHRFAVLFALVLGCALATGTLGAGPKDDPRATFSRFIASHNARDVRGVGKLLSDSPDFLWITPGHVVRGRDAAVRYFRELYRHPSRVDIDWSTFQSLGLDISTTEIFVSGAISEAGVPRRVRINVILVDTARGWRVRTLVVENSPPNSPPEGDKGKARPDGAGRAIGRGLV